MGSYDVPGEEMEDRQTTGATRSTQGRVIALLLELGSIIVSTVLAAA